MLPLLDNKCFVQTKTYQHPSAAKLPLLENIQNCDKVQQGIRSRSAHILQEWSKHSDTPSASPSGSTGVHTYFYDVNQS